MATLIRATFGKSVSGSRAIITVVPSRGITGRELRKSRPTGYEKPKPFDYVKKDYGVLNSLFDRTTHRIDENSKVIVVEGPIAAGKSEFAKKLAEELEFHYYPEASVDMYYKRSNGMDLREFDPLVPEDTRTFDNVDFCKNPTHRNVAAFQLMTYRQRYSQYVDALCHVLNTGQGVVLERSPYSDFVFLEAMFAEKFVSPEARRVYYEVRKNTLDELMRPHLVVYLDLSVQAVKDNIKSRGHAHEVNSKALTDNYLKAIEYQYKYKYLGDISSHAELLVYDWSGKGEIDVVVEDIERIDFEKYTERLEPKMKDWRLPREMDWMEKRQIYTNGKNVLMGYFNLPLYDAPELIISADDAREWDLVVYSHPKFEYATGYTKGNTGLLFKNDTPKYMEWM